MFISLPPQIWYLQYALITILMMLVLSKVITSFLVPFALKTALAAQELFMKLITFLKRATKPLDTIQFCMPTPQFP